VYDLLKRKLIKKLDTGLKEASSIAVHPGGIIISYEEIKLSVFF
jgi:ribosome biogenesis protein ERB1